MTDCHFVVKKNVLSDTIALLGQYHQLIAVAANAKAVNYSSLQNSACTEQLKLNEYNPETDNIMPDRMSNLYNLNYIVHPFRLSSPLPFVREVAYGITAAIRISIRLCAHL